jgi:hypothetical protein
MLQKCLISTSKSFAYFDFFGFMSNIHYLIFHNEIIHPFNIGHFIQTFTSPLSVITIKEPKIMFNHNESYQILYMYLCIAS